MTGAPLNVILRPGYAISEAADMMRIVGADCDLRRYEQRSNSTQCPLSTKRLVRHSLGQSVQMQIEIAHRQNGADQDDTDHHHQGIGVARRGDEAWQMMGGAWMK